MTDQFKNICIVYEYLFGEVSNRKWFRFEPNERHEKLIKNFIKRVGEHKLDNDFIFNYLVYQFSRYYDAETRFGVGIVQLNWVTGDKALKKWNEHGEQEAFRVQEFKVSYSLVNPLTKPVKIATSDMDAYNEKERSRFYNTERGFIHCQENALYSPKSNKCNGCKFKENCF